MIINLWVNNRNLRPGIERYFMKPPNNKYNHKIPEIREAVSYESKRRKKDTTKKENRI